MTPITDPKCDGYPRIHLASIFTCTADYVEETAFGCQRSYI